MADSRRMGILALLILLAGGPILVSLPLNAAAVRLAGVSLLWWYSCAAAPLVGATLTVSLLVRARRRG
jgi:hypothetical protein